MFANSNATDISRGRKHSSERARLLLAECVCGWLESLSDNVEAGWAAATVHSVKHRD